MRISDWSSDVCSSDLPWGQGPVLLQSLALLKGFDLAGLDSAGPDFIHLVIEAMKLAYADREIYYGDPKFCSVPLEHLLSSGYNDARRALISESAHSDLRPGRARKSALSGKRVKGS